MAHHEYSSVGANLYSYRILSRAQLRRSHIGERTSRVAILAQRAAGCPVFQTMPHFDVAPTELVAFWGCGLQICRSYGAGPILLRPWAINIALLRSYFRFGTQSAPTPLLTRKPLQRRLA